MAKADIEIKYAVEQAIHAKLQSLLQQIWDDHGICIQNLSAKWTDVSSVEDPKMLLDELTMQSNTKRRSFS